MNQIPNDDLDLKISDIVVDVLSSAGVRTIFGIAGGASLHLLESVVKHPAMKLITTHHEQAAAMAADAHSRVTGNLGVAIVTSGPGATNLITGIAGCFYDSIPTVFITGQVSTTRQSGDTGTRQIGFQETPIVDMVAPIVKYAVQVSDAHKVQEELEKCIFIAKDGRPGPVLIDIPDDIQRMLIKDDSFSRNYSSGFSKRESNAFLTSLGDLVRSSKRPIIVCGSGINLADQRSLVINFLQELDWPTLLTWGAVDLLEGSFANRVGTFGTHGSRIGNFTAQNADLIISIGTRLDTKATGSPISEFAKGAKIIMFDIDKAEIEKFEKFGRVIDLPICLDLRDEQFSKALDSILENAPIIDEWNQFVGASKKKIVEVRTKPQSGFVEPYRFINLLSKLVPSEARVFIDTGCAIAWTMEAWEVSGKHRLFHDFNNTAMGWALPALIGSLAENLKIPSIAIIGDGSFMMSLQELSTLKSLSSCACIFILNNSGYSMIKQTQDQWFNSEYFASDANSNMLFPNFKKLAEAFGFDYVAIDSESEMENRIDVSLNNNGPTLCEVFVSPLEKVTPIVKFGNKVYDMDPKMDPKILKEFLI